MNLKTKTALTALLSAYLLCVETSKGADATVGALTVDAETVDALISRGLVKFLPAYSDGPVAVFALSLGGKFALSRED